MTQDPIPSLLTRIDERRLRDHLFHLSSDPLPYRKLNYTVPGHDRCTLYEADDYIAGQLEESGHDVEREAVTVQAFRYAFGRGENPVDSCAIDAMYDAYVEGEYGLSGLLEALVRSDAFRYRRAQEKEAVDP